MSEPKKFLTTVEAAAFLNLRPSTILRWRREHRGPPVVRLSVNRAIYAREELEKFAASRAETFENKQATESMVRP